MSLLAVTVGADPSAVVGAVRAVGWYGVDVCHRLAGSGGCYDALSAVAPVDACCDTCGLRPVVEVSLYAQPGMVDRDVSACGGRNGGGSRVVAWCQCELVWEEVWAMSVDDVNMSVDKSDVEAFLAMSPVIFEMSDEEFEEFMRIVESDPVTDERLARLFERPSPFGKHIDV